MKRDWLWVALIASVLLNIFLWGNGRADRRADEMIPDTIFVHDTIKVIEPTATSEKVVRSDTAVLERADKGADTVENLPISGSLDSIGGLSNDSAKVVIPITERTYEDSTYKAVVRGYNPELVSLDIYNTTKYYPVVEKVKIKPKVVVSAGVYGGFGSKGADYGLGIMVGVPIWSW